ncbi:unnamed protein product [Gordionus sp. m RMFG-2023]
MSETHTDEWGTFIDKLSNTDHGVSGNLYVADENTLFLNNFNYDGKSADAFFLAGNVGSQPSPSGFKIPTDDGNVNPLAKSKDQEFLLKLPNMKVSELKWFSVWSDKSKKSLGEVIFKKDSFQIPKNYSFGPIPGAHHNVHASEGVLTTDKTILLKNFNYDGLGPDAYFLAGKGESINHENAIKIPNEQGSLKPVPKYSMQTIELTLPDNKTWSDFNWFSLYCIKYTQNFASVFLPDKHVLPPYNVLRKKWGPHTTGGGISATTITSRWIHMVLSILVIYLLSVVSS